MSTSALFNGVCYPTIEQAQALACSTFNLSWGDNNDIHTAQCVSHTSAGMDIRKCVNGENCIISFSEFPAFLDCDFSGGVDLGLSWLYAVLPIMATLWGIKRMIALFSANRED